MQLPLTLLSLVLSLSVVTQARTLGFLSSSNSQISLNNGIAPTDDKSDLSVPGKSPLRYCDKPDDNILEIYEVNLDPNPPKAGENLTIVATGTLKEDIEEGAEATVEIKYGYVRLPPQKIDICESIRALNKTCPIKKGDIEISTVVKLPDQVPPGKYWVKANAYTKANDLITCLEADVTFP